jgi:site-specific recombinase XerD
VLTEQEASKVIAAMDNAYSLMATLMYGSGLRLIECLRLPVKDVDFSGD